MVEPRLPATCRGSRSCSGNPYLVTVRDLVRIDLDAELVTLSACSTGLQREANAGEEWRDSRARCCARAPGRRCWRCGISISPRRMSCCPQFYRNWSGAGMAEMEG